MQKRNPYTTPESDLHGGSAGVSGGSIEAALAGESNWEIGQVISESWQNLAGFKGSYWLGLLIYFAIAFAISFVFAFLAGESVMIAFIGEIISNLVTLPILAGIWMIALRRAADLPVSGGMVLQFYQKIWPLFLMFILISIFTMLGFLLLIIPGIYLAVAYSLAIPLMVEKDLDIWESMEVSRKAVSKCWFRMFGLFIVLLLILAVSAIPLGIGLIWALPLAMLTVGTVYREMFGVELN